MKLFLSNFQKIKKRKKEKIKQDKKSQTETDYIYFIQAAALNNDFCSLQMYKSLYKIMKNQEILESYLFLSYEL